MSSDPKASPSSTPNFQPIFEKALEEYKKKTGKDLTTHPLAAEINGCHSPDAILIVLQGKTNELNQSRISDDRLTKWLNPTVNILNALSATLGDTAGSVFPPTKIIFSGIGILLVAARDTVANRDVLVKLFARIESFFDRLKIYTNVPPSPAVTDELAKIMAEVLSILATATKGMKEKRIKTFFKKVAGMSGLEDALQRFGELEQRELLTGIAQVSSDTNVLKDDARETKADVKETKTDAKETKAMVKEIADKLGARDLDGVLQKLKGWLSPPDPSTNYNIGLRDLHEETATWFLEGRIFQEWYSMGSLLWIHGKPGLGKSILCSAIIQRVVSLCDDGRASVAYFYFDFRDDNKKHLHDLLPSLLFQFAAHSVPCCDLISRIYSTHGKGTQKPSDEVLINCLMNVLSAITQDPVYIIVDALDECPNASGVRSPRERVFSFIKRLVDLRLRNLHICVTSRLEIDIRIRLEPLTSHPISLYDQTGHKEDIAKYINSEVDVVASDNGWPEDDKELVIKTLSEKADGMFRWVYCQLEMLRLCFPSMLQQFVNELPDTLDETYERVLKGIPSMKRSHVHRLLQCLTVAVRPLRVVELAAILTSNVRRSEDQEQEVLSACPSLITIVDSDGSRVVQFSHFSVKEFLTSDRLATSTEDTSRYHIHLDAAHTTLARVSLGVLLRLGDRVDRSNANNIPLVEYAAEHWVSHAQVGSVSSSVLDEMKTLFDSDKPHFAAWRRIYDIDEPSYRQSRSDTATPLYYSALCGFYDLVEHLAKKHSQHVNAIGGTDDYPLAAALYEGHIRVAELLFRHGANIDAQGTEGRTPLHTIARSPNNLAVDAVRFLLGHDADVNAQEGDLSTPLHHASSVNNLEVARMLLDNGAYVNAKTDRGRTPFYQVTAEAYDFPEDLSPDVARLLIERGADVNAQDKDHGTPLHFVFYNQLELARILLDCGANVNAKNKLGHTPLREHLDRAGDDGTPESWWPLARLFVERGVDVNELYNDQQTLLHWASGRRGLDCMQNLLDFGANVNAVDKWGRTPLHLVHCPPDDFLDEDRIAPTQLLVVRGADVNQPDDTGEMPLHMVLRRWWDMDLELVRILVDLGSKVNMKDHQGQTPLHTMLEDEIPDEDIFCAVLQLWMEHGADVNAQNNNHETLLHLASHTHWLEKRLKIVWTLLGHGADLSMENKEGKTPFQLIREELMEEMEQPQSEYFAIRARRVESVVTMSLLYGY